MNDDWPGPKAASYGSWEERKTQRRIHYELYVQGWKKRTCTACSGSGKYDSDGSPRCSSCNGTGKERYRPGPQK